MEDKWYKMIQIKGKILTFRKIGFSHLELLFLTVFALPNASRTGLDCKQRKRWTKNWNEYDLSLIRATVLEESIFFG